MVKIISSTNKNISHFLRKTFWITRVCHSWWWCVACWEFVTGFDRKRYRTLIATKNAQLDNLPGRCNSDFLLLYFCLKSNSFCRAPNFNQNRMPLRYLPVSVSLCSMFTALVSPVPALGSRCLFCAKTQIESKLGRWIWTELFIPTFHLSSSGIPNSILGWYIRMELS